MAETTKTVTVAAPPEAVWEVLVDLDRANEWQLLSPRLVAGSKVEEGASYTMELSIAGQSVALDYDVVECVDGQRLAVRAHTAAGRSLPTGLAATATYTLEPRGTGTAVSVQLVYPQADGRVKQLAARAASQADGEMARRSLQRLAELVLADSERTPEEDTPAAIDTSVPEASPAASRNPESTAESHRTDADDDRETAESHGSSPEVSLPPAPPPPLPADSSSQSALTGLDHVGPGEAESAERSAMGPENDEVSLPKELSMSVERARSTLMTWGESRTLVDPQIFSSELTVTDAPCFNVTVTRVIETRGEERTFVPASHGVPSFPRYNVPIDAVQVPAPTDFEGRSWRLMFANSDEHRPCPEGCNNGQQQCRRCKGGYQSCLSCGGGGRKERTEYVNGKSVRRVEVCGKCAGNGRVPCSNCRASGWVRCEPCQGAGSVIWFLEGNIRHEPAPVTFAEELPSLVKPKKLSPTDWVHVSRTPGDAVPVHTPEVNRSRVTNELARTPAGELLRKVEVRALPVTRVALPAQPDAEIVVAGTSGQVFATGVRSPKRIWLAILVVIVIAAVIVGALVLA